MRPVLIATLAAASLWAGSAAAQAPQAGIAVTNPWARASAGATTTGAAYLTLVNSGPPDSLTGASTPVAGKAEVHETTNVNGVMQMRAVPALPLEPNKPLTFAPGGYHVMLMGLHHPLKQGETFPLTLSFAHAPPMTVEVKVGAAGAAGMPAVPGMHHMDGTSMPSMQKQ